MLFTWLQLVFTENPTEKHHVAREAKKEGKIMFNVFKVYISISTPKYGSDIKLPFCSFQQISVRNTVVQHSQLTHFASQKVLGKLFFGYGNVPGRFVWLTCGLPEKVSLCKYNVACFGLWNVITLTWR